MIIKLYFNRIILTCLLGSILFLYSDGYCDKINLSAGSKIKIRYKKQLTTESVKIQSLSNIMEVVSGDVVAGIEVFRPEAKVYGEVLTHKKPGRLGKPGYIKVRIDSVEAIGGSNIAVKPIPLSATGKSKRLKAYLLLPLLGYGYFFVKGGHAMLGEDQEKIITVKTARFEEIHF